MGFLTPSAPPAPTVIRSTPTVKDDPPVVTEVQANDIAADYDQKAARRKGLLSTILTNRSTRVNAALTSAAADSGNTTLG